MRCEQGGDLGWRLHLSGACHPHVQMKVMIASARREAE